MCNFLKTDTILFFLIAIGHSAQAAAPSKSLPEKTIAQKQGLPSSAASPTAVSPSEVSAPAALANASAESTTVPDLKNSAFALSDARANYPKFRLGLGYTHSRWSRFTPRIKDGSYARDLGFEREWGPRFEAGLHVNFINASTDTSANENVRAFHLAFVSRYLLVPGHFQPFVAFGLGVGTYRVWSLGSEFPNSVTFIKHGKGVLFGLLPEVGMRFVTSPRTFFDLSLGYTGYLSAPQWQVGGVNVLLAFGVSR